MGKTVNVMLYDQGGQGLFETEFKEEGTRGIYAREYQSGSLFVTNDKGVTIAEFKANEWLAYAVEKVEEDGDDLELASDTESG